MSFSLPLGRQEDVGETVFLATASARVSDRRTEYRGLTPIALQNPAHGLRRPTINGIYPKTVTTERGNPVNCHHRTAYLPKKVAFRVAAAAIYDYRANQV